MNAPPLEIVIRLGTALAATVATILLGLTVSQMKRSRPLATPAPLLRYLTWVVGISAIWRWFLFWLGFQTDLGDLGWTAAWIQPINATIIWLLYMGLALIGFFHLRVRRKVADEVASMVLDRGAEGPDG